MIKATALALTLLGLRVLTPGQTCAQVDFGYVPVGTTNTAGEYYFAGGSWNGTNLVMTVESTIRAGGTAALRRSAIPRLIPLRFRNKWG
jgi:hypothetical protein